MMFRFFGSQHNQKLQNISNFMFEVKLAASASFLLVGLL